MPFSPLAYMTDGLVGPSSAAVDTPVIGLCLPEYGSTVGGNECVLYGGNFGAAAGSVAVGGAAAAIVAWSDVRVTITMPAGTAGAKTIALTTADAVTANLTNGYTYFAVSATDPILTRIETSIETLINGMSIATGFCYDHGVVNQEDRAHWNIAQVNHMVELEPEIENLEANGLAYADRYYQRAKYKVTSWVPLATQAAIPKKSANAALNKCLDDLLRLFGRDPSASATCTLVQFERSERVDESNNDRFVPKKLLTYWIVDYTQSRIDPERYAN